MSEEKGGGGISLATKSRYNTPENFFPIVVDNFFDDSEALVHYGKSLPKEKVGNQPGKRSKHLWEIDEKLNQAITVKILSCYYDLEYMNISWRCSNISFHEIPRFSENKNDIRNRGWIHQDNETYSAGKDDFELAGLIYLTPDIDPDSGTSLYNLKSHQAKNIFTDGQLFDRKEYAKKHIEHEENFKEKLRFQNIFNRLIAYDTNEWHRANSFYNDDGKDARLTLSFFVGGIDEIPLKRIKNTEYESIIKLRIGKNENK